MEGWAAVGVVPRRPPPRSRARAPKVTPEFVAAVERPRDASPTTTWPRSSTWSRRRSARPRARGSTTGSPRPTWSTPRCAPRSTVPPTCCSTPRARWCRCSRPGPLEFMRHAHGGPHARHARRAHDLRGQAGAVVPAGRPRPGPPACRARRGRGGEAVGRGRHLLEHRPPGGGVRVRRARAHARSRDPGDRARPPRRVAVGVRVGGRDGRDDRDRDPPPGPHRGGRGRRGVRRGPEGQLGHAPQAQPDPLRAPERAGPACCAATSGAGLEDVALWHERDISHSSVERVDPPRRLPARLLRAAPGHAGSCRTWWCTPIAMRANVVEGSSGWSSASRCCWPWWRRGWTRDVAYRIVQRDTRPGLGGAPTAAGRARGGPRGHLGREAGARPGLQVWSVPCSMCARFTDAIGEVEG